MRRNRSSDLPILVAERHNSDRHKHFYFSFLPFPLANILERMLSMKSTQWNWGSGKQLRCFLFLCALLSVHNAVASDFPTDVGQKIKQGKPQEAIKILDEALKTADEQTQSHIYAYKGLIEFKENHLSEANEALAKVKPRGSRLEEYVRLTQAQIAIANKDYKNAINFFHQALASTSTARLQFEIRFQMARTLMDMQDYRSASAELEYLAKKAKSDPHYPEVLWNLITVDKTLKRRFKICGIARDLYTKYPAHPLVAQWGMSMRKNVHEGETLDCTASPKDVSLRMRRLQLSGLATKARGEIDEFIKTVQTPTYEMDELLAQHLTMEGYATEALNILAKYAEARSSDVKFLIQFGNMAARAGQAQLAVGAYDRAAKLAGNSKNGRLALFQSAFLSYRFQDYDGADRRFRELLKKASPRSALARDVVWNLAWIKYLRNDWSGAADAFREILKKYQLPKDSERDFSYEKVSYWLARSQMHQGENTQAAQIFSDLSRDPLRGYYSLASGAWLKQMGIKPLKAQTRSSVRDRKIAAVDTGGENENPVSIENEISPQDESASEIISDELKNENPDEKIEISNIFDPRLASRLERAKELINLGYLQMAEWELLDIEKRTRNSEYLKTLMVYYQMVGGYNRASYIASTQFSPMRAKGMEGVSRAFWEAAYPRAFEKEVTSASRKVSLPREFIWAIMRAESQYRPAVYSSVGAMGLMQLMPFTAEKMCQPMGIKNFRPLDLLNPETNILLGSGYLDRLSRKFQKQLHLVAGGYNAGPHRVEEWLYSFGDLAGDELIEHVPFVETRAYIKKVLRNYQIYAELYQNRRAPLPFITEKVPFTVASRPLGRETWD